MTGHLYGIGVGPGDPELMTLKAVRILKGSAVIAYPAPESGESAARAIAADFIPSGRMEIAIRVPMRPGRMPVAIYDRAAENIAAHLEAGRDVAVLCEGDPFFYGSFMYLHDRLAGRFASTVVPATLPDAELERRLRQTDAAAIMKLGRHAGRVQALLERLSLSGASTYVAHASRPAEKVLPIADLGELEAPYFSMILVSKGGAA